MSKPTSIERSRSRGSQERASRGLAASYRSQHGQSNIATVAEESIARDLDGDEEHSGDRHADNDSTTTLSRSTTQERVHLGTHSMAGSYRRPGYVASGPRPFFGTQQTEAVVPMEQDYDAAISEERSLLRDNQLIPPKHPRKESSTSSTHRSGRRVSVPGFSIPRRKQSTHDEEEGAVGEALPASETTALLPSHDPSAPYEGEDTPENIDKKWEDAVLAGKIQTTWQRESKVLARYSGPLILTFFLQNSLTLTSIFTVGHIGKIELGAVSLGSMTANITGYAVYQGLSTSLDTLCAQAYGSGNKKLVGLQLQRMVYFLWLVTIPIATIWFFGGTILGAIVPEQEVAEKAGQYLKVLILGAPGYALFESAKRYCQSSGNFEATMYVLMVCAPINVLLHWLFVWKFEWGFIGCPIAVIVTETLMTLFLFLHVRLFIGLECWPGFSYKAFRNWGPMIRLALPGLLMVLAEWLAFELLTLSSSWISSTHLAAQTVLMSLSVLTFQLPFPVSVAASTRVANLIGATLPDAAKVSARVALIIGTGLGLFNGIWMMALRHQIPHLYTSDDEVVELTAKILPLVASFQLFDALGAIYGGLLRGLGFQEVGGYVALFAYYVIAMPISFGTGFGLHWDLFGLWFGPAIALFLVCVLEHVYIYRTNWQRASEDADKRNDEG
ncbi:hypothetical protein MBLNU230_g2236t1 [Neophaeotheca triangularis]